MYADTMACGIASSNAISSVRSATPYGSAPSIVQPSNTLRSASTLTALDGQPTHALTLARIRSGIEIPKSLNPERQRQNLDLTAFELDDQDMADIAAMDNPEGHTFGQNPHWHEEA